MAQAPLDLLAQLLSEVAAIVQTRQRVRDGEALDPIERAAQTVTEERQDDRGPEQEVRVDQGCVRQGRDGRSERGQAPRGQVGDEDQADRGSGCDEHPDQRVRRRARARSHGVRDAPGVVSEPCPEAISGLALPGGPLGGCWATVRHAFARSKSRSANMGA